HVVGKGKVPLNRVKKGDSLFSISRKYDANVNKVADINDLPSSLITVGQRIFIPGASLTAWQRAEAIGNIFENPTQGRIASRMGFRKDPFTRRIAYHAGVDIANTVGTRVCAAQFGRVIFTGYKGDYGKAVVIAHPQEYTTLYAPLDKITVRRGQSVSRGETIGRMGNTGRSTGPHLHFEVHQHNKLIDPLKMVRMR
ncbi:MAG: M23 family metallopeptidase, partial [Spirochaetota bacterium]